MMGELVFIGLGLFDEKDITLKGLEEAKNCEELFAEFYTSILLGTTLQRIEELLDKKVRVLTREEVEKGDLVVRTAALRKVGFLVPGDPMSATTHVELRLRAHQEGIRTRIIHGPSIVTAAAGLLGLQSYKFGRSTTVPFTETRFRPTSPLEVVASNLKQGLHTLVLLDIREGREFLDVRSALTYLLQLAKEKEEGAFGEDTLVCVVGNVGSNSPLVRAGRVRDMLTRDFGKPLHCLVIPGELHFMEREALKSFAGAPPDL